MAVSEHVGTVTSSAPTLALIKDIISDIHREVCGMYYRQHAIRFNFPIGPGDKTYVDACATIDTFLYKCGHNWDTTLLSIRCFPDSTRDDIVLHYADEYGNFTKFTNYGLMQKRVNDDTFSRHANLINTLEHIVTSATSMGVVELHY